jgi:hypothetical protein
VADDVGKEQARRKQVDRGRSDPLRPAGTYAEETGECERSARAWLQGLMVADDVKPAKEKTPANHDAEPVVENDNSSTSHLTGASFNRAAISSSTSSWTPSLSPSCERSRLVSP